MRGRVTRGCDGETASRRGRRGVWDRGEEWEALPAVRNPRPKLLSRQSRARGAVAPVAPGRSTCLFYHILALHVPLLVPIESASHADLRPAQPLAWHGAQTPALAFLREGSESGNVWTHGHVH